MTGAVFARRCGAALLLAGLAAALSAEDAASRREKRQQIDQGLAAFQSKDYAGSVAALEIAQQMDLSKGELLKVLPALGRSYEAQGNYQRALTIYEQARELKPRDIERLLDLARVYAQVDLNAQAIDLYNQVLKKDKNRRDVVWALAMVYAKDKKWDEARAAVESYLAKEPQDASAQSLLADIQENLGFAKNAAHIREGILASSPTAAGFELLGNLWSRQDELDLAANAYERAEKAGARSADFWLVRGTLAWRQNLKGEAAAFWNKALAQDPQSLAAQFLLALADIDGKRDQAAAARMKKIQETPAHDNLKNWSAIFQTALLEPAPVPAAHTLPKTGQP